MTNFKQNLHCYSSSLIVPTPTITYTTRPSSSVEIKTENSYSNQTLVNTLSVTYTNSLSEHTELYLVTTVNTILVKGT